MPGSSEQKNARRRARRLILQGDPGQLAAYFGVRRATVVRWRRTGIPEARIGRLVLETPVKPQRVAARYTKRVTARKTRIWEATSTGPVKDDFTALLVVDALRSKLEDIRYPEGATFQWVLQGTALHDYSDVVVGHYNPVQLKGKGKKLRTKVTVPSKASGRLDVALDALLSRLTHLEPFFTVESVKMTVRKAKS
jgi:hypothetical protein